MLLKQCHFQTKRVLTIHREARFTLSQSIVAVVGVGQERDTAFQGTFATPKVVSSRFGPPNILDFTVRIAKFAHCIPRSA